MGVDAVVHRDAFTGVRLALADGRADLVEGAAAVSASSVPAPVLGVPEAVEHLRLTGLPFVFFVDADHRRGCVLHHRFGGGYGLVVSAGVAAPS